MILTEIERDAGSVSAEYAMVILAAAALAAVLYAVVTGQSVHDLLTSLVEGALEEPG